jgi:ATP-binding cassette subfamily B (MDR/TAP) protein 1
MGKSSQEKDGKKQKAIEMYPVPTRRVWSYAKGQNHMLAMGVLCSILSGGVWPGMGLIFSEMLSSYANYDDDGIRSDVMKWGFFFFGIATAQWFIQFGMTWGFATVGETIVARVRALLFRSILRQDVTFFDDPDHSSGALLSMLGADTIAIQQVTGNALGSILGLTSTLAIGIAVSFSASWQLSLFILALFPLLSAANVVQNSVMMQGEQNAQSQLSDSVAIVSASTSAQKEVQAFGLRNIMHEMFCEKLQIPGQIRRKAAIVGGVSMFFSNCCGMGFYAAAFACE